MRIGVPKEIKDNEFRVGLTPSSVAEFIHHGHSVAVEAGAGAGSGLTDAEYVAAGATLAADPAKIFAGADMIIKVKEPLAAERKLLRPEQLLFTYLHLAPDLPQTRDLIASGAACIAYETVTSATGGLPLLTPMSEVAGRLAPQVGAHCLEKAAGGRGILLGGVPGVPAAEVIILGGGVSGTHAATIALGMGANVTVVDRSPEVLRRLSAQFGTGVRTIFSTRPAIAELVKRADLLIGTVLVPGAAAPKLVTRAMLATMKPGAMIVICGSGGTIDEPALADAVRSGHLAGAAMDSFSSEPLQADNPLVGLARDGANILLTPHTAAGNRRARSVEYSNILRHLHGEPILYRVV